MSELITLAELAEMEHITQDAARKRVSRGWYDKVKMNGKTYYRKPAYFMDAPADGEKIPAKRTRAALAALLKDYTDTEPDPEDVRPDNEPEPFPGAWDISDTFDAPWEDMDYFGETFKNDPEAVRMYCFLSRWMQDTIKLALMVANKPDNANYRESNRLEGIIGHVFGDVLIQAEVMAERMITAWIEDGKPNLSPEYLTEKFKAGITDPADALAKLKANQ